MGLFDALDPSVMVTNKLKSAAESFAQECNCPVHSIQIRIEFSVHGHPHYLLYYVGVSESGAKQWVKKRAASLDEII